MQQRLSQKGDGKKKCEKLFGLSANNAAVWLQSLSLSQSNRALSIAQKGAETKHQSEGERKNNQRTLQFGLKRNERTFRWSRRNLTTHGFRALRVQNRKKGALKSQQMLGFLNIAALQIALRTPFVHSNAQKCTLLCSKCTLWYRICHATGTEIGFRLASGRHKQNLRSKTIAHSRAQARTGEHRRGRTRARARTRTRANARGLPRTQGQGRGRQRAL